MSFLSSIFPSSSGTPVNAGNTGIPPATPLAGQQAPAPAPAAPATPATPAAPASPLDQYAALWQSATNADGKPIAPSADPLGQPIFNFDPTKITESASRMDFTTGIPAETIQKALGGDAAAFAEALNLGIRQAVVGMTMSNGQLINQAVVANNQRVTSSLPTHIKSVQLQDQEDLNPVFAHPAAQPLVASLKKMAMAKDPTASAADINKQIAGFLTGFSQAVVENLPENRQQQAAVKAGETDWSTWA